MFGENNKDECGSSHDQQICVYGKLSPIIPHIRSDVVEVSCVSYSNIRL